MAEKLISRTLHVQTCRKCDGDLSRFSILILLQKKMRFNVKFKLKRNVFKTLQSGEQLLRKFIDEGVEQIDGELAFKLYDTYGFPLELTLEIAKENGLSVDVKAFNQLLDLQRERARNARADLQSMGRQSKDLLAETSQSVFVYDQLELITCDGFI